MTRAQLTTQRTRRLVGDGTDLQQRGRRSAQLPGLCPELARRPDPEGAPGRNRTCDTRFRKPLLYPLSYEGASGQCTDLTVLVSRAYRALLLARAQRASVGIHTSTTLPV